MHVEVRQTKDVVILDLKGRLTAGLGEQVLREAIDELLAEGRRQVLLNLSEVASSWRGSRPPAGSAPSSSS